MGFSENPARQSFRTVLERRKPGFFLNRLLDEKGIKGHPWRIPGCDRVPVIVLLHPDCKKSASKRYFSGV